MAMDPSIDSQVDLALGLAAETTAKDTFAAQERALEVLEKLNHAAEDRIAANLDRLLRFRQQQFDNFLKLLAELERLGVVDLARVSPILDPLDSR